jgi:hypothetical protein
MRQISECLEFDETALSQTAAAVADLRRVRLAETASSWLSH